MSSAHHKRHPTNESTNNKDNSKAIKRHVSVKDDKDNGLKVKNVV